MRINLTKVAACSIVFLALFFSPRIFAQKALTTGTDIVAAINSDTTSSGTRNNTSYTLARGGVYFALGQIQNDFELTITATGDESLADPILIILVDASNNYSTPFKPYSNLTLEGIAINGVNSIGSKVSYIIEAGTTDIRISLKNCDIDSVNTAAVRVNQNYCSVYLEDCTIQNVANGGHTGRVIDARSTIMDTISIVNCTFYNVMHNVLGRFSGGQEYFKFDHNTVYNLMRCPLRIDVCPDVVVTNNLFLQTGFVGYTQYWETEFQAANANAMGSRDEFTRIELWPLDSLAAFKGMTQNIDFTNNNLWVDPTIEAQFPDTIYAYRNLDFEFEKAMVGADTLTWISEDVSFTNAPACDYITMAQECWKDGSPQTNPGFNNSGIPYDFSYSTSSASYTAATGGFPLGDLNWFPSKKAEWLVTDVKENETNNIPSSFSLEQNYPNPFNPTTVINYSIPKNSNVVLKVYNILGKEIATLVNGQQSAGSHNVSFNASNLASGVYFYSIQSDGFSSTKKMMLLK